MIMLKYSKHTKRFFNSIKADTIFQFKHGFYYIYIILSVIYVIALNLLNQDIIKVVLPILVFTDPSVLGMFFIGGMVLLEKEQGIIALLYITPLRVYEYLLSKLLTLSFISIIAGVTITALSYWGRVNFLLLITGILLTSVFFTQIGFIISTKAKTVIDYLVKIIPWMLIMTIPCFSLIPNHYIPHIINVILNVIPSVAGLKIVLGSFNKISLLEITFCIIYLIFINIFLFIKTKNIFENRIIFNNN